MGEDCAECYAPFIRMEPLHFQEGIREEAEEEAEHDAEQGGHFKKNCLEHVRCLNESEIEGVF